MSDNELDRLRDEMRALAALLRSLADMAGGES